MQIQQEVPERLVSITNHILITLGYKLIDFFDVHRSFKTFIRVLRRKNTEEGKISYTDVEETAWRERQALINRKKEENSIQNLKQNEVIPSYDVKLHGVMIDSLKALDKKIEELSEIACKVKDKGKIDKVEDHEVEDSFGQDVFGEDYQQCIIDRKKWTDDELIQQMKSYERIDHRLTKMIIKLSISLAQEKKEEAAEEQKRRRRLRRNDQ